MRTPALAIGGAIWYQNRRGLITCAWALLVMAVAYPFLFSFTRSPAVVISSTVPLIFVFGFVLNSLLVVEEPGSLSSSSPRHRFVFPVRTHTLVFWPMLYGWMVAGLLWLATAGLIYRSSGFQTPLLLPALGIATLMVWVQAISWLPFPNSWLRDTMTIVVLATLAALPVWLTYSELTSPALVAALLIGYTAMAYPLGLIAVETDRRGEVWRVWPATLGRDGGTTSSVLFSRRRPFRSAGGAQFWYEWRCHGLIMPGIVGLILLTITLMLIHIACTARRPVNPIVFPILLTVLVLMPVIMAGSMGPGMGRLAPPFMPKSGRFITFVAIRPMTSGGVVAAKFRMAIVSGLLTCAVVVVMGALLLVIAGSALGLAAVARAFFQSYANPKGFAVIVLGFVLLPALTWKQATGGFASALSGRRWIADGVVFAYLPVIVGLVAAGLAFVNHPEYLPRIFSIFPYLVVSAAILKGTVAIVTFRATLGRGLITWSSVGSMLVIWLALSACAFGCVLLVLPSGEVPISKPITLLSLHLVDVTPLQLGGVPISKSMMLLSILAFMPLSRFALSTLALDWNRHR
jgi:hypothetical protein